MNPSLLPWPVSPQETTVGNTLVHQKLKGPLIKLKSNQLLTIFWQNFQIEFELKLVEVRVLCWHIDILQLCKSPPSPLQNPLRGRVAKSVKVSISYRHFIWSFFNVDALISSSWDNACSGSEHAVCNHFDSVLLGCDPRPRVAVYSPPSPPPRAGSSIAPLTVCCSRQQAGWCCIWRRAQGARKL